MIPPREPYEGKATLRQKQKLWDLGYREQDVIDQLGKRQASTLIDFQLKQLEGKKIRQESEAAKQRLPWLRNITLGLLILSFGSCMAEGHLRVYGAMDWGIWIGFAGAGLIPFLLRDWARSRS